MPSINPMQFIQLMKSGGNPQQMVMNMLQQQNTDNPMMKNILDLAQKKDSQGLENIARNICKERGLDFDKEFNSFKSNFGL